MSFMNKAGCLLALALASTTACAEDTTYTFVFTGFAVTREYMEPVPDSWDLVKITTGPTWDAAKTMRGSFSGTDLDRDGILERAELSTFSLIEAHFDYLSCGMYRSCFLDEFSYSPAGGLHFRSRLENHYEDSVFDPHEYATAGDRYVYDNGSFDRLWARRTYAWTPDTQLVVTPSEVVAAPVPEPAGYQMLAVGAALAAVLALRRRKTARPLPFPAVPG